MVVVAKERSYPQKRAEVLVFWGGGCQGVVNLPKTSASAHFQGLWVVVVARERSCPPKTSRCSFSGVVGAGGRLTSILKLK